MWRALGLNCLMLAWVGLLAIGASGLIAAAMNATLGPGFVAGDLPGNAYTPDRCADLMEYAPTAATCAEAAAIHHADEVVTLRIAAGMLGLIAFGVWWLVRRRTTNETLPPGVVSAAGAATFGVVGIALAGLALNALALGGNGGGSFLSGAVVALVVALSFAGRLVRELRSWSAH
jgi:hypothetical protein